jgi:hypothetical protein
MFVKPADGLKVRDPHSRRHLPPQGAFVPREPYWLRRLDDGDVVDATPDETEE